MNAPNTTKQPPKRKALKDIVADIESRGMRCNCDLDNWQPEQNTGHSWVCRIHKAAISIKDLEQWQR